MSKVKEVTQGLLGPAGLGDLEARSTLLERYRDHLRRMVATRLDRRLASRVDASDIVQETLADAALRLDDYLRERPLPFLGWLRQLAGERVVDAHRHHLHAQRRSVTRESRTQELNQASALALGLSLMAQGTSPSNRLSRKERLEKIMAALDALHRSNARFW